MTPKGNPMPHKNQPNTVLNVPDDPDPDPSLSDYFSLELSDSSGAGYPKQGIYTKNKKTNFGVKRVSTTLSISKKILQLKYLKFCTMRRSQISNWMTIHYSAGFIYDLSLISI